jgi:hypothetical protein
MATNTYTPDSLTLVKNISFSSLESYIPEIIEDLISLNLEKMKYIFSIDLRLIDGNKEVSFSIYFNELSNNSLSLNYKLINEVINSIKKELKKLENNIESTGTVIMVGSLGGIIK